jgi:hypothetical protein
MFSLQLNTNTYVTILNGYSVKYWEQFLYITDPNDALGYIEIQYWILGYPANLCSGLNVGGVSWGAGAGGCVHTTNSVSTDYISSGQLTQGKVSGIVSSSTDTVKFYHGSHSWAQTAGDYLSMRNGRWTVSEFNVFAKASYSTAVFSPGVSLTVQTTAYNGAFTLCDKISYTSEMNNLNLGASCGGSGSYITFTESD